MGTDLRRCDDVRKNKFLDFISRYVIINIHGCVVRVGYEHPRTRLILSNDKSNHTWLECANILNKHTIRSIVFKLQPLRFSGGFYFYVEKIKMHVGAEIEIFRKKYGFAVSWFCTTLDMTESEYRKFIHGQYRPRAYQLVFFLTAFKCVLTSIENKTFEEGYPKFYP